MKYFDRCLTSKLLKPYARATGRCFAIRKECDACQLKGGADRSEVVGDRLTGAAFKLADGR